MPYFNLHASFIFRQVRIVKDAEEEIRQLKRKLENFDRYASASNLQNQVSFSSVAISPMAMTPPQGAQSMGSLTNLDAPPIFDKDFECSVCLDDMKPPVKIFQCKNGHVMCESCKNHPEVMTCPTCRIPLPNASALMRNIPMEKLARSYFEKMETFAYCRSRNRSRRGSYDQIRANSQPPSNNPW